MSTIESVKRETATAGTIRGLERYILHANLRPGSSLMSESQLCEKFQVSRIVVREALQHFKSLGIIDSRPQRGAAIKNLFPSDPYRPHMNYVMRDPNAWQEIVQLRSIIERGIASEIMERITPEQLAELERINTMILDAKAKQRMELDIEFHTCLLNVPGNRLLTGLRTLLYDYFKSARIAKKHTPFDAEGNRKVFEEHQMILKTLQEKDLAGLQQAMEKHIQGYRKEK